jgi:hypothetical protein
MVKLKTPTSVPVTFVDLNHFSGNTGNSIIVEQIWWVGPNTPVTLLGRCHDGALLIGKSLEFSAEFPPQFGIRDRPSNYFAGVAI